MSAFQPLFDNASTISVSKTRKVSQTVSRDGVVKTTSLGGQTWEFVVEVPQNQPWKEWRGLIESIEAADRVTPQQVTINTLGQEWITEYQGDSQDQSGFGFAAAQPGAPSNSFNILQFPSDNLGPGEFWFRRGDFIQLVGGDIGDGFVYTVAEDVPYNSDEVVVHRPIREELNLPIYNVEVGPNVKWNVICVQMPSWTLTNKNLVSWDGVFVFAEVV